MADDQTSLFQNIPQFASSDAQKEGVICPICGAVAVQEKCKIVCRSEICRGRVVMNCSEF